MNKQPSYRDAMHAVDRREVRVTWWELSICVAILGLGVWFWGYWVARSDAAALQSLLHQSAQTRCEVSKRTAYQNLKTGAVFCRAEQRFESIEPSKGDAQ